MAAQAGRALFTAEGSEGLRRSEAESDDLSPRGEVTPSSHGWAEARSAP